MSDNLLYAISSLGRLRFDRFYEWFDIIYSKGNGAISPDTDIYRWTRRSTMLAMESLGHCEIDYENRMIHSCPPRFISMPNFGTLTFGLVGSRTPDLIKNLKYLADGEPSIASVTVTTQTSRGVLIPAAISLEVLDFSVLVGLGNRAHVAVGPSVPAAWMMLNYATGMSDLVATLEFRERADINWPKEIFSADALCFSEYVQSASGERLIGYVNPVDQQRKHLLWSDNSAAEVDRSWGRYYILFKRGRNILLYDGSSHKFGVPVTIPLPRLFNRALTACSGLIPRRMDLSGRCIKELQGCFAIDVYDCVPPVFAELVSEKLGQNLIEHKL